MSKPLTEGSGWCGGWPGIQMSFIRTGPRRRLCRRERKWVREKSHRFRRMGWRRWPALKPAECVYFLNQNYMDMAWMEKP